MEMERSRAGSASSSRRDSVDLPAPEGLDRTNMSPRRSPAAALGSLDIGGLLAQLVDAGLQIERHACQGEVNRFRTERVGFAVKFLGEEFKPPSSGLGASQQRMRFLGMRTKAIELF